MSRHALHHLLFLLLLFSLTACGGKTAPPLREDVEIDLHFLADRELNPNSHGRSSPIAVRYFFLNATDAFDEADYFALTIDAKATLGTEMVPGGKSFVIRPGGRHRVQQVTPPNITAIGFVAGYRDISNAGWRAVHIVPVPPEVGMFSSTLKIKLDIKLLENDMHILPRKKD